MIRCLSCRKSSDNPNLYIVKLISDTSLDKMPTTGKNVVGISNSAVFADGSELIISTPQGTKKYIYEKKEFASDDIELENNDIKDNNPKRFEIDDDGAVYIG